MPLWIQCAQLWKQPLTFKPDPAPPEHNHLLGDIKLTSTELLSFHRPMKVFIWHLQSMVSSPAVYFLMVQELKIMSSYTVMFHKHFWFSFSLTEDSNFLIIILYEGKIHALYMCMGVWGRVIELCNSPQNKQGKSVLISRTVGKHCFFTWRGWESHWLFYFK